jgi:hypothetical protein
MALRATMSKPTVAKASKPAGLKAAVQKVAAGAAVSVASLALAFSASADVSGGPGAAAICVHASASPAPYGCSFLPPSCAGSLD